MKMDLGVKKQLFFIDSNNINTVENALYGYYYNEDGSYVTAETYKGEKIDTFAGNYVRISVTDTEIYIERDHMGGYGLYLYKEDGYFAISNSFLMLVENISAEHKLTVNEEYADVLMSTHYVTYMEDTLYNEVSLVSRTTEVLIDKNSKELKLCEKKLDEYSVQLNSKEGIELLDKWMNRWCGIVRRVCETSHNLTIDLSAGFDTRVGFAILANSGINKDDVYAQSIADDLHTHTQDFAVAKSLSKAFNLPLNRRNKHRENIAYKYSVKEQLENEMYLKLGFHKQWYFKEEYYEEPMYVIGGFYGETVRDYIHMTPQEFIVNEANPKVNFDFVDGLRMGRSVDKSMNRYYKHIEEKYHTKDDSEMINRFNREYWLSNHFGKIIADNLTSNIISLMPMQDRDLHRLTMDADGCDDKNLLIALIYIRYCDILAELPFDGGHTIKPETLDFARMLNEKYSKWEQPKPFRKKFTELFKKENVGNYFYTWLRDGHEDVINKIMTYYHSDDVKDVLLNKYGERYYAYPITATRDKAYFPLTYVYSAIAVSITNSVCTQDNYKNSEIVEHIMNSSSDKNSKFVKRTEEKDPAKIVRFDMVNSSHDDSKINDIEIVDISDKNIKGKMPDWFVRNGIGYILHSSEHNITMKLKMMGDGTLNITLRGQDVRDENGKRIPVWIDYNRFSVGDNVLFGNSTPIWHDKAYYFTQEVSDGEVIEVNIRWDEYEEK